MTVYYSPSDFGLETVAELELSEPDYSFDLCVLWRHSDTGVLYWQTDSGCSCPSPFEDYRSLDEFVVLSTELDYDCLVRACSSADDTAAKARFLRVARTAMKG